jgi:alpha-mannosidase
MLSQESVHQQFQCAYEVFGQFNAAFSPILPEALAGIGLHGALHVAFDGTRLPKPDQCKTWWGPKGAAIQALAARPLDVAQPETWLRLAERIGDTIARDHVATILLAGWPGTACEYYDDLRRAARFGPVLGKLVTLEEYFRISREPDEWTTFHARDYPFGSVDLGRDPIETYRVEVQHTASLIGTHLSAIAGLNGNIRSPSAESSADRSVIINPWNFTFPQFVGFDPLCLNDSAEAQPGVLLADVPGCGYATFATAAPPPSAALANGLVLRNEQLELTVSETTGGIQSLRTHRDRSTRVSQRLVLHDARLGEVREMKMIAEQIRITRNDAIVGQITSDGRLLDSSGQTIARFIQTMRVVRGLGVAIVDVQLDPARLPDGDAWCSYFASRIAWSDDALALRRGVQWTAREIARERIESPEWVEINDGIGTVTCFALGLPYHRQAGPTWLDTLLVVAGEKRRRFQFALGIDVQYPTQTALGLVTASRPLTFELPSPLKFPSGWFLHIGAKNVLITHVEPLTAPRTGIRLRLLETMGRETRTTLAAFRPFHDAQTTDFRGQPTGVLSITGGRAEFEIGADRWIQIEAEW